MRSITLDQPPEGFSYYPDFLSMEEERALMEQIMTLDFSEVRMHGVAAKRHVAHFGWIYGYESWRLSRGPQIPDFLLPVQRRAAHLLDREPKELSEILVTEYPPGAGIGWHRDAPMFGPVVLGLSLQSACRFRFRRDHAGRSESRTVTLESRSLYILRGPARVQWQHSIPSTKALRYSITLRTVLNESRWAAAEERAVTE
ncbi:MAG TPA: alpha-ketoglutarate-dependent dioxygenase AlkB [Nitrospiraceae bacterium]|jgi:alkylated DNA repair protein (DNA oxidative demethylase)|nr:alpha-ketoglutarate-dependent dioxygenase AlkB [Nitrospiraceae bacterium]